MKMSKSEIINSALDDRNNGTEESETSYDEYFSDFLKLQPHMYEPCLLKVSMKENCAGKESSDSEEDTSKIQNFPWCSCGKYKPMATHAESISCLDKYEIRES